MMANPQLWPIFICYRRADGIDTARRLHEILDKWETIGPAGELVQIDAYLDETMPGVEDWKTLHRPYLEKARAMIVICTPGTKLNEGADDYVHKEIDWWLKHRKVAPILIDPLMEGLRFVPLQIVQRFPDIQRIALIEKEWVGLSNLQLKEKTDAIRRQTLGAILPSGAEIYKQELELEKQRTKRLRWALTTSMVLLVISVSLGAYTIIQRNFAVSQKDWAKKEAEYARRGTYNIQLARVSELWQRDPSLSINLLNDKTRAPLDLRDFTWGFLYSLSKKELITLPGHGNSVTSVAFSPDSKTIASASRDNSVKLWDAQTGQQRLTLIGHGDTVFSVAFSPDGKTLASASRDMTIKLWDTQIGQQRATLTGHSGWVSTLAFSSDSMTIASASWDKTIKLWKAESIDLD